MAEITNFTTVTKNQGIHFYRLRCKLNVEISALPSADTTIVSSVSMKFPSSLTKFATLCPLVTNTPSPNYTTYQYEVSYTYPSNSTFSITMCKSLNAGALYLEYSTNSPSVPSGIHSSSLPYIQSTEEQEIYFGLYGVEFANPSQIKAKKYFDTFIIEETTYEDFLGTTIIQPTPNPCILQLPQPTKQLTIYKDPNLLAENIKKDITIEGVTGTLEQGTTTQEEYSLDLSSLDWTGGEYTEPAKPDNTKVNGLLLFVDIDMPNSGGVGVTFYEGGETSVGSSDKIIGGFNEPYSGGPYYQDNHHFGYVIIPEGEDGYTFTVYASKGDNPEFDFTLEYYTLDNSSKTYTKVTQQLTGKSYEYTPEKDTPATCTIPKNVSSAKITGTAEAWD